MLCIKEARGLARNTRPYKQHVAVFAPHARSSVHKSSVQIAKITFVSNASKICTGEGIGCSTSRCLSACLMGILSSLRSVVRNVVTIPPLFHATIVWTTTVSNAFGNATSMATVGTTRLQKSMLSLCAINAATYAQLFSTSRHRNSCAPSASHSCTPKETGCFTYSWILWTSWSCWSVWTLRSKNT